MTDIKTLPRQATAAGRAVSDVRALRNRLAEESPAFKAAIDTEAEAEGFCREIREELRKQRKIQGLDQSVAGKRLDMSQSAVSKIEKGEGDIGAKTIFRYARALGLHPVCVFMPADPETLAAFEDAMNRPRTACPPRQKAEVELIRNISNAVAGFVREIE
jgi:transcriptional regulator with XRE-family HTH domain